MASAITHRFLIPLSHPFLDRGVGVVGAGVVGGIAPQLGVRTGESAPEACASVSPATRDPTAASVRFLSSFSHLLHNCTVFYGSRLKCYEYNIVMYYFKFLNFN